MVKIELTPQELAYIRDTVESDIYRMTRTSKRPEELPQWDIAQKLKKKLEETVAV
jgi:hypothetical protein